MDTDITSAARHTTPSAQNRSGRKEQSSSSKKHTGNSENARKNTSLESEEQEIQDDQDSGMYLR
jgi:hypothetical protein